MRKRRKEWLTVEQVDWLRVIESATYVGDKGGGPSVAAQNGPRYFDLGRPRRDRPYMPVLCCYRKSVIRTASLVWAPRAQTSCLPSRDHS